MASEKPEKWLRSKREVLNVGEGKRYLLQREMLEWILGSAKGIHVRW